jgi:hypothetical protein
MCGLISIDGGAIRKEQMDLNQITIKVSLGEYKLDEEN